MSAQGFPRSRRRRSMTVFAWLFVFAIVAAAVLIAYDVIVVLWP